MRVMPDFCTPHRGFRHDLDSAMAALRALEVEADRVVVRSAGPGWVPGTVMGQAPAPGTPLTSRTRVVVLSVAGAGGVNLLPYPLRDGADDGFNVDRLMALSDNPLGKLALHVRQAGGFLALHPDDEPVILRWIEEIFQLSAGPFPRESWYALARLLPALHRVAGTEEGVRLGMALVFGLPVAAVRPVRDVVPLAPEGLTRLGLAASRLGMDTVAGAGVEAPCVLEVTLGPLTLAQWREHHGEMRRTQRQALYRLLVPAAFHDSVRETWAVGDPAAGARPGDPRSEPVLGINARLGAIPDAIPERSAA